MITPQQVVDCARSYVGTPFQHQARIKGLGLDCIGLILCVARDLGIADSEGAQIDPHEYPAYSADPLHGAVHAECCRRLIRKPLSEMRAGDIVTMRVPIEPCHVGIIADRGGVLYIIHAYNGGTFKTVEHILDDAWRKRIVGVFRFPGVE